MRDVEIEKFWVIQRNDDGKFLSKFYSYDYNLPKPSKASWTNSLLNARSYKDYELACCYCPSDCKVVCIKAEVYND